MIELPRHLRPWAAQLSVFPNDIASSLGEIVARLCGLLGGWRQSPSSEGNPNGYGGIGSRGSYDQLLPTEWLLHDQLPEEFLRRVASHEHNFFQRDYEQPTANRWCTLLFDTGVEQLGSPRIAHIALLILLTQRAAAHKAKLNWGLLNDPSVVLHDLDPTNPRELVATVQELLRARRLDGPNEETVDLWKQAVQPGFSSECWVLGGERAHRIAESMNAFSIEITDVLVVDPPDKLQVILRQNQLRREVILDIPARQLAVRLLRDPFSAATAPPTKLSAFEPAGSLVLSANGRRVYLTGKGGQVASLPIPNSPRATPGNAHYFALPPEHHLLGIFKLGKSTLVLSQKDHALYLHQLSKQERSIRQSTEFLPHEYQLPPQHLFPKGPQAFLAQGSDVALVPCADGSILRLLDGKYERLNHTETIGWTTSATTVTWASLCNGNLEVNNVSLSQPKDIAPMVIPPDLPPIAEPRVLFLGGGWNAFSYPTSPSCWVVVDTKETLMIRSETLASKEVVGLARSPDGLGLLALEDEGRTLRLLTQGADRVLFQSVHPISCSGLNAPADLVVTLTHEGELVACNTQTGSIAMRASAANLDGRR